MSCNIKENYGGHGGGFHGGGGWHGYGRGWHGHGRGWRGGVGPYGGWGYGAYGWPYNYVYQPSYETTPDVYIVNPTTTQPSLSVVAPQLDEKKSVSSTKPDSHRDILVIVGIVLIILIIIIILIQFAKK
jgi:hypothetical protein